MNRQIEIEKLAAETTSDPRWLLLVAKDKGSDGKFFYSVKTTGVYCRPSCAARLAHPGNVRFYTTTAAAENAGFRACKRCKPAGLSLTEANTAKIEKVCRLIERSEKTPSLEKLAKHAGMSVFHLHRTFKAITGLTPSGYGAAHRTRRVRKTLGKSQSVTDAIYDAGFNSNSRFYESANEALGMTLRQASATAVQKPSFTSRSRSVRSAPSWWPRASAAFVLSSWVMIRSCWHAICKTNFSRQNSLATRAATRIWSPR